MSYFAKIENDKVVQVIRAEQNFVTRLDGEWIQTSFNTRGGKHYDPETGEHDGTSGLRYNYAGVGYTYDRDKDAFVPPQPYPSFVLNETTQRYEPPIPYPQGLPGGPQRFIWDEEHYQEHGEWFDRWDTSDSHSQYNPDSKYYLEDLPKYEDDDYPFNDIEQTW